MKEKEVDISTVLTIEKVISSSEILLKKKDIEKILKGYFTKKEISLVISHLEDQNKIYVSKEGITWLVPNDKMRNTIKNMVRK